MNKDVNMHKPTKAEKKAEKKRSKELDKEYSLKEPMTEKDKKLIAIIGVLVVICAAVWFKSGLLSGAPNVTVKENGDNETTVSQAIPSVNTQTDAVIQTTQPSETQTDEIQQSADSQPESEKNELQSAIDKACEAVNAMKHKENFTAVKNQEIHLELVECSVPGMTTLAKPILERFGKTKVTEFTFENGTGYDSNSKEDVKASDAIPPTEKDFKLEEPGIASFEVSENGENTKYVFNLIEEKTSLDNPVPTYHAMALDYLDLSKVDIAPAEITQADFTYSGAKITVEVDPDGNLIYFEEYMPMHTVGAGKLGLTASGTMEGYIDEVWTFGE